MFSGGFASGMFINDFSVFRRQPVIRPVSVIDRIKLSLRSQGDKAPSFSPGSVKFHDLFHLFPGNGHTAGRRHPGIRLAVKEQGGALIGYGLGVKSHIENIIIIIQITGGPHMLAGQPGIFYQPVSIIGPGIG